jgi:predicted transcriptional regulator
MAKVTKGNDDLSTIGQLLRNLLAIELWRGGLSQAEIGKKLGMAAGSVNKMLKGVSRVISSEVGNED